MSSTRFVRSFTPLCLSVCCVANMRMFAQLLLGFWSASIRCSKKMPCKHGERTRFEKTWIGGPGRR